MRRGRFIPMVLASLVAVACSGESENSAPSALTTQAPAVQPTEAVETPAPRSTEAAGPDTGEQATDGDPPASETQPDTQAKDGDPPGSERQPDTQAKDGDPPASDTQTDRQELIDAFAELVLADELVTTFMTRQEITCLAEGAFAVFTDERLDALELNPDSFTEAYRQPGLFVFGDWFDISDWEAFDLENLALGCVDWRNFVVQVLVSEGEPVDQAQCIASQISVDGLRAVVRDAMVVDAGEGFGAAQDEVASALTACYLDASPATVS